MEADVFCKRILFEKGKIMISAGMYSVFVEIDVKDEEFYLLA